MTIDIRFMMIHIESIINHHVKQMIKWCSTKNALAKSLCTWAGC